MKQYVIIILNLGGDLEIICCQIILLNLDGSCFLGLLRFYFKELFLERNLNCPRFLVFVWIFVSFCQKGCILPTFGLFWSIIWIWWLGCYLLQEYSWWVALSSFLSLPVSFFVTIFLCFSVSSWVPQQWIWSAVYFCTFEFCFDWEHWEYGWRAFSVSALLSFWGVRAFRLFSWVQDSNDWEKEFM